MRTEAKIGEKRAYPSRVLLAVLTALLCGLAGAGCGNRTGGEGSNAQSSSPEETIRKIENDPNIPAQAKARVAATIRANTNRSGNGTGK